MTPAGRKARAVGCPGHTVPEAVTKATLKQYRHSEATTDILEFADRAQSLTIDHGLT